MPEVICMTPYPQSPDIKVFPDLNCVQELSAHPTALISSFATCAFAFVDVG